MVSFETLKYFIHTKIKITCVQVIVDGEIDCVQSSPMQQSLISDADLPNMRNNTFILLGEL